MREVVYLVPESAISGGQRVVFQQAEEIGRRGFPVTIVSPDPPPRWYELEHCAWEQAEFSRSAALARAEVCVATFWTTVRPALERARGPVFHLCQGYEADFTFYAAFRDEIKGVYALPTRKLTIAPYIEERLRSEGYSDISTIGQVFDPEEFPPPSRRRFDADPPTILVIGIFQADVKGIRETLDALRRLADRGVRFRLRRISPIPSSDEEKAFALAQVYDVAVHPREMSRAYQSSDLLIGPSHAEEGFGLPVLEALSSGLPVLLSDTAAHRHIAGNAAVYFRSESAEDIAAKVPPLLSDPAARRRLSRRGPRAAGRFRTRSVVDRLLGEFSRAVAKRATPAR